MVPLTFGLLLLSENLTAATLSDTIAKQYLISPTVVLLDFLSLMPLFLFLAKSNAASLRVFPGEEDFFFSRPSYIKLIVSWRGSCPDTFVHGRELLPGPVLCVDALSHGVLTPLQAAAAVDTLVSLRHWW
jgi:hypothetical protein